MTFIFSPTSTVQAINYEAQINVGFPGGSILLVGDTTTLRIDILNTNAFALDNVSFTNSLVVDGQTGLVVHSDGLLSNTCGGIVIADPGSTTVSLSGGEVPVASGGSQGQCQINVRVVATSPGTKQSYVPSYGNEPSWGGVGLYATGRGGLDIITNATRDASITTLTVNPVTTPSMSKNFSPSTIWAGESTQLEINLTNNDSTNTLTGATYTDTLPAPFVVSSPLTTSISGCGSGTITTSVGSNTITLTNGTILPLTSCRIRVRVVSSTQGTYTNRLPAGPAGIGSLRTNQYATNPADVTAPVNVQAVGITKVFNPTSFAQGDTSTLTITLRNPSSTTYTNMHFDDTLPTGPLVVTGITNPNQCGGTVTISPDNKTITLNGGIVPSGNTTNPGTCTVVVQVTSPTSGGPYTNTIPAGEVTGSMTNLLAATAQVTVVPRTILVTKFFGADFVENGTTTLRIRLRNQTSTAFTGVTFTDTMPANLTIVGTPTTSSSCGTTAVVTRTSNSVTLTNGVIPAGSVATPGECNIYATVTSSVVNIAPGYTNDIPVNAVCSAQAICNASSTSDTVLTYPIGGPAVVAKTFGTATILPGSNSLMTITITSPQDTGLTQIHLRDNFPGDMVLTSTPVTTCAGGVLSGGIGSNYVELTGGAIANPNTSCTITANVTAFTPGTHTNTIPANSLSTYQGRTNVGDTTQNLAVTSFRMTKQFAPDRIAPGGLSVLTVFLRNSSLVPITSVSLSDNLGSMDQVATGYTVRVYRPDPLLTPGYEPTSDCGGTFTTVDGASTFSISGATVPASDGTVDGLCRINIYVRGQKTSGTFVSRTNTIGTSSVSGTINGTTSIRPLADATDILTIEPLALTIDKAFNPLSVYNGSYSVMTILLDNPNNPASLSQIAFTDTMDPEIILADPVSFDTGTCGGTLTGNPGDHIFSFAGGSLPADGSCSLSMHVTLTATGNYYNTIPAGSVTTLEGATNSNLERETLTNAVGAYILKSFSPNPIQVGQNSILSIEITNTSTNTPLTGMGANDHLPTGLVVAGPIGLPAVPAVTNTCGGTFAPLGGDTTIQLSGASIATNSSCLITIPVTTAVAGTYKNIIVSGDVTPPIDPKNAEDTLYVTSFSLGNRVWEDNGAGGGTANDGIRNGSEPGISGLAVNLYRDSNNDGTPDGTAIATQNTDANGYYRFDALAADTYIVEVAIPSGYVSSAVNGGDPDTTATDNDNNGVDLTNPGFIRSNPVTLEPTAIEPTNDNDPVTNPDTGEGPNDQSNRTVDFGFYRPFSLGNRVWNDLNGDGDQDTGEPGLSGVSVRLYRDTNTNNVADGAAIAVTVTDTNGYYRFDDLYADSYLVEVVTPAGFRVTNNPVSDPNGSVDLDHNGIVVSGVNVRSNFITLGPGAIEPTLDNDPLTNPESGEAPNNQSNRTVDFGFTASYSLGNRVWLDNGVGGGTANDGLRNGTEAGMGGITVNLYQDSNDDGTPDGGILSSTTTNSSGYYRFDQLAPDTYIVEVVMPTGYQASPNPHTPTTNDPDVQVNDLDNNGVVPGTGVIRSNPVTLGGGAEPTGETDPATNPQTGEAPDAYSNRTVDFGLYTTPLSLGNLVWVDNGTGSGGVVNNGIHDGTEPGLAGVTVRLYRESNLTTPVAITETDASGNYLFSNLAADIYRVEIVIPTGYTRSSTFADVLINPTNLIDDDNNGTNLSGSTLQSNPINLTVNNPTIDFGLIQLASLGDRVWYDTNRDGIQDGAEQGVTGVTVRLYTGTPGSGTLYASTTTSGGGYYNFSDLAPRSDYYVEFTLPTDYTFTQTGPLIGTPDTNSDATTIAGSIGRTVAIDLSAFENDLSWDAGIYIPPASIGDRVWNDNGTGSGGIARDGQQNGSEPGVSGVRVDLYRPGYGPDGIPATSDDAFSVAHEDTDLNGNYLFDELLPGNYYVSFTLPDGYAFTLRDTGDNATDSDADTTTGETVTTSLIADEDDLTWDAGLYQLTSIGDYVWLDHGGGTPANAYNGVQNTGETGVAGVTVNLYNGSDTLVASTSTASNGSYLFANLEPGDYYVEFIPPTGYSISPQDQGGDTTDSDADTTTGQTIETTLAEGENDLSWDAGLYQYAAIGNYVWDDNGAGGGTPRDGIQDSGEPGVSGVTVTLYNGSGVQVGSPTTTDANGYYEFTELVPGNYYVEFSDLPSGYQFSPIDAGGDTVDSDANLTTGRTVVTTLDPGENDITWDAGIHMQTAELGDYVWYDDNGDGIQGTGETRADGITVTLYNASSVVIGTQTTDSNGKYLFENLNPGFYYVGFTAPTSYFFTLANQGGDDLTDSDALIPLGRTNLTQLTPGESDLSWDAGLYTNASLGNFVWEDWNRNGVQDTGEPGMNGVSVELFRVGFGSIATTTTADLVGVPGYYFFDNLVPGDYYVVFTLPSGYVFTAQGGGTIASDSNPDASGKTPSVTLSSGESDLTVDAGLVPLFNLGNRVWYDTDNDGSIDSGVELGIPNVRVELYESNGTTEVNVGADGILGTGDDGPGGMLTSATGHYLFQNLPAGNYRVALPATNFSGVLDGTYSSFSVRNSSGNIVETSSITANLDIDSDDNGDYSSGRVISSIVTLGLEYPANEPLNETDLGTGGQGGRPDAYANLTVDFGFYTITLGNEVWNDNGAGGGVTNNGSQDGTEPGIEDVDVQLWSSNGTSTIALLDTQTTDSQGRYQFTGLPAGDYIVRIPADEFESGGDLLDLRSSFGGAGSPYEPAPDSDDVLVDQDDNGQEMGGIPGLGGYVQTKVITLSPGAEQSVNQSSGLTTENRVDFGLYDTYDEIEIIKTNNVNIVAPGSTLTYEIDLTNNGDVTLTTLTVTDTLPEDVTFVSATPAPTSRVGNLVTWDYSTISGLTNLGVGETIHFEIVAEVIASPSGTKLTNEVEAVDDFTSLTDEATDVDNITKDNVKNLTATEEDDLGTVPPHSDPDPDFQEPVLIGEILTYTTRLDIPQGNMLNLQALDVMDRGLAFVRCVNIQPGTLTTTLLGGFNAACNNSNPSTNPLVTAEPVSSVAPEDQGRRVLFNFGNVTNSGTTTQTLIVTYEAIVLDIAANRNGTDDLNNALTWTWNADSSLSGMAKEVTINEPQLTIEKTAQPTTAIYGTPINFTLVISHAAISSAPAYDVILTDVLPAGLAYIPLSASSTGLAPNDMIYDPTTSTLTFVWANFPLAATSTITFQATFIGPSPVTNQANLEWTSIEIDPQLDGTPEQRSIHNIFATERWFDPPSQTVNDYQASASVRIQTPDNNLPSTGFKLGESTVLPLQPQIKTYTGLGKIWLEIPKLKLKMPITGVPYVKNDWDLTWLSDQAGYLEGSTFPGQVGNTAITGHVVLADGTPGPFQSIEKLVWGDQIILHINGEKFIYEVRQSINVLPSDYSLFRYDGYSWVTLITCDEYNKATDTYLKRTLVKAVLVKTEVE